MASPTYNEAALEDLAKKDSLETQVIRDFPALQAHRAPQGLGGSQTNLDSLERLVLLDRGDSQVSLDPEAPQASPHLLEARARGVSLACLACLV